MNLFLDTISPTNMLVLFDDDRNIITTYEFDIRLNESSKLIPEIDNFLKKNNLDYFSLKNIVLVVGPGSFTGVRTSVLAINTIAFVTNCNLTPITYFDLFDTYPIIKVSSRRDVFYKKDIDSQVVNIYNDDLESELEGVSRISGDANFDFLQKYDIISRPDYNGIIKNLVLDNKKILEPLYIKKPNIS